MYVANINATTVLVWITTESQNAYAPQDTAEIIAIWQVTFESFQNKIHFTYYNSTLFLTSPCWLEVVQIFSATDCKWGDWTEWQCRVDCGSGIQTRNRTKTVEQSNGGSCEGVNSDWDTCQLTPCETDGNWVKVMGRKDSFFHSHYFMTLLSWYDVDFSLVFPDPCKNYECNHGICANTNGNLTCICYSGFEGDKCENETIGNLRLKLINPWKWILHL